MRKYKVDPNLLIALGVLIASFSALFVYIQQASIMREQTELLLEQTKANAWPHLTITMSQTKPGKEVDAYKILVSNRGTGPAIVEGVSITYRDQPAQNWDDFINLVDVPDSIKAVRSNNSIYDYVFLPGETLMVVDWTPSEHAMRYIYERADEVTITICYRSVYNDYWQVKREGFKSNLEQNQRKEVEVCSLKEEALFLE